MSSVLPWLIAPLLLAGGAAAWTLGRIAAAARSDPPHPADALLVLGAGIWGHGPSPSMRVRVDAAVRLYQRGIAPAILCSGGYSHGQSEAGLMRRLLIDAGVPADAVTPDDHGTSTREALRAARRMARGRWREILVVSSPYHLYRIEREARRQGLAARVHAAARGGQQTWRRTLFDLKQYLREVAAVWMYAISAAAAESLPARAWRQLHARIDYLTRGADAVASSSERIEILLKPRVGGADVQTVMTPASGLQWPIHGRLGHRFGMRHGRLHAGLDVGAAIGTDVVAAAPGRIAFAGWLAAYGNTIVVDHGAGLSTVYAHLQGLLSSAGTAVGTGDLLGRAGETGRSFGPHLHFEVRVHGSPVDPLAYLSTATPPESYERHGQRNAVWTESLYFRGHDPKRRGRLLHDRDIVALAQRLVEHRIRYVYLFAGPFEDDGRIPAYAFSRTAQATLARLRELAPDVVPLPWIGGLERLTVHLDDPAWVSTAIAETARLIAALGVAGVHINFECIQPTADYVLREKRMAASDEGLAEYGRRHVEFHQALRARLPGAFVSSVVPSTSSAVTPWKRPHTPDEAAALACHVSQIIALHYDTSIRSRDVFTASLAEQLQHIARWKADASSAHVECLLGVGTFTNARPLRRYRDPRVEGLPHYFRALDAAIAGTHRGVRLVDGLALFSDWTTTRRDWRVFRQGWIHGAR